MSDYREVATQADVDELVNTIAELEAKIAAYEAARPAMRVTIHREPKATGRTVTFSDPSHHPDHPQSRPAASEGLRELTEAGALMPDTKMVAEGTCESCPYRNELIAVYEKSAAIIPALADAVKEATDAE